MPKSTYVMDVFGTVLDHKDQQEKNLKEPHTATPGTVEKIDRLRAEGNKVILMTAHPEHDRTKLTHELHKNKISYDGLIMDAGHGTRYMVNDRGDKAVHVKRNAGLGSVHL